MCLVTNVMLEYLVVPNFVQKCDAFDRPVQWSDQT